MFGPPGGVYVYRHMGLHYCMNLTCGPEGTATAVLIRAGEVVDGEEVAWRRRNGAGVCRTPRDLARGPARLTVALAVTGQHNGIDIFAGEGLSLEAPRVRPPLRSGPRIGVRGIGADPDRFPWRLWIDGDDFVSGQTGRASLGSRRASKFTLGTIRKEDGRDRYCCRAALARTHCPIHRRGGTVRGDGRGAGHVLLRIRPHRPEPAPWPPRAAARAAPPASSRASSHCPRGRGDRSHR